MLPLTASQQPTNRGIQRRPNEENQNDIEQGTPSATIYTPTSMIGGRKQSKFNFLTKQAKTITICITLLLIILFVVLFFNGGKDSSIGDGDGGLTMSGVDISVILTEKQNPFYWFANLLTNPNQKKEGSYGWYQQELEKSNQLGRTQFKDSVMTRFGFQETGVTGKDMFYYFRTFNIKEQCPRQHSCQVYPTQVAGEVINKDGVNLDAVLHHYNYQEPFFLDPLSQQKRNIEIFQTAISVRPKISSESNALEHSTLIDKLYGESMWRGMRRLTLYMCSEAVVGEKIAPHIQKSDDPESMKRFSESTADISVCFQRTCSVWVNYLYYPIEIIKSALFGKKPLSKNKGICAFISNCNNGPIAKTRYDMLKKLSSYVPIRQYGACGNNAKEGPGGKQFELENNCRFYFAAENSIVKDYVTEKFFEGVKAIQNGAKLLMIYKGAPNIKDFGFPSSMYINTDEFETVEELGKYLQELDNDDAFESRFAEITEQDRAKIDLAIRRMDSRLGSNIPCRLCQAIGQMKLARYLLFKIGLNPNNNKVNQLEWDEFKQNFASLGSDRLQILDQIYYMAYSIFHKAGNYQNMYNLGWSF